MNKLSLLMLIRDLKMRTLRTGDQQCRLVLESLCAEDVPKILTELASMREIWITIEDGN